jgi:carboxyl-terminal processing protease
MRQKEQVGWGALTVVSLAAFSYFAGLGLRGLIQNLSVRSPVAQIDGRTLVASAAAAPRVPDPSLKPGNTYFEVLKKLKLYYVEDLPPDDALSYGSIEYMLNELKDTNTRLLSKVEVDALQRGEEGYFPGLGAVVTVRRYQPKRTEDATADATRPEGAPPPTGKPGAPAPTVGIRTITVVTVAPGSPAEKAGILPGDRITEMDGHWVAPAHLSFRVLSQITDELGPQDGSPRNPDLDPEPEDPKVDKEKEKKEADEARARFKGATDLPSTLDALLSATGEHELTIERGVPSKTLKVKATFGQTHADVFSTRTINPTTGYMRILVLGPNTVKEAAAALASFQKDGVKNLVVDLRRSPGGSLEAATGVVGLLAGNVKVAVVKERNEERKLVDRGLMAHGNPVFRPVAVSVLVDGGTAGSAEVLAAALRDHLSAKLVGSTTFGDGTEQELRRLNTGAAFSITHAKMLTSKGVDYDGKGLNADVSPQGDPVEAAVAALSTPARAASGKSQ